MSAIIAAVGAKLGWVGVGMAIPIVLGLAKKLLPKYLGGMVRKEIGEGLSNIEAIADPKRKELILAVARDLVKLAEYEIPDPGTGADRYEKVAGWLCAMVPFLKGQNQAIEDIIEASVKAMDDELKKAA